MNKKISTYAKENNISYKTVWRMVKSGKLESFKLPTGTILIKDNNIEFNSNKVILYARVSSSENKSNIDSQLQRLKDYASAKGYIVVKEIKEIGSGLNDNRKKLLNILNDKDWNIIIVEHKDRLSRFGIKIIELLLNQTNRQLEIINETNNNDKEDLTQDFVSIITSFCARLYGLRRSKRKTEKIIEDLKNND